MPAAEFIQSVNLDGTAGTERTIRVNLLWLTDGLTHGLTLVSFLCKYFLACLLNHNELEQVE